MTALGVVMVALASVWLVAGGVRVVHPGDPARMRPTRRFQGALMIIGAVVLTFAGIAVMTR